MNLEKVVADRLIYWAEQICSQVRSKWQTKSNLKGNKEIHHGKPKINPGIVLVEIIAHGQAAWEIEFGRGSLMDTSNPYLQEYLSSTKVNPWRFHSSRMPIMGRSPGEYTDLDGNKYVSSGKMQGLDLERDGKPEYQPVMPMHVIRDEIDFTFPLIIADISEKVAQAISEDIMLSFKKDIYV